MTTDDEYPKLRWQSDESAMLTDANGDRRPVGPDSSYKIADDGCWYWLEPEQDALLEHHWRERQKAA